MAKYIDKNFSDTALNNIGHIHSHLLSRAAAFLLLKDSKASYTIEGEQPKFFGACEYFVDVE